MEVFSIILLILLVQIFEETEESNLLHFGTKTAYNYQSSSNHSVEYPMGCSPIHIEYVGRHGSRFPSNGDREKIDNLLDKLKGVYNTSSPFRYKNLTIPWMKWVEWNDADPSELSPRGELEQYEIAKRLRRNFPKVFNKQYWNKYYKFLARDKRRTEQSAMAFVLGLFENETDSLGTSNFQPVAIQSAGLEDEDKLLSSYDACPRYSVDVDENGLVEYEKFIEGQEIKDVIKTIEKRLRINGTVSLNLEDVDTIRKLCAFGVMNHNDHSWCPLLDSKSLGVLNYADDLENFYESSFGNELSYKIICVLLGDITKNLEEYSKEISEFRGVFRFASSGTLFSLLTMLGVFDNGTTLRADNFMQSSNRKFPSNFVPMSANIVLVLYECNSTDVKSKKPDNKVQILVNEEPVSLPCCQGNLNCSLNEFLTYFKDTVDTCDFDAMCSLANDESTTPKAWGSTIRSDIFLIVVFQFITLQLIYN